MAKRTERGTGKDLKLRGLAFKWYYFPKRTKYFDFLPSNKSYFVLAKRKSKEKLKTMAEVNFLFHGKYLSPHDVHFMRYPDTESNI